MASDPERGALAERHLGCARSGVVPLPFRAQETLLLDADDVGERGFPFFEVSPDSFAARRRRWHSDEPRRSGLCDLDDFDAAHDCWSLLVATFSPKSSLLCSLTFFCVSL
jgi:hypothetical protein